MINDHKAYAQREKYYMQGKIYPDLKVGMLKVNLTPTVTKDNDGKTHTEKNEPCLSTTPVVPIPTPTIRLT